MAGEIHYVAAQPGQAQGRVLACKVKGLGVPGTSSEDLMDLPRVPGGQTRREFGESRVRLAGDCAWSLR